MPLEYGCPHVIAVVGIEYQSMGLAFADPFSQVDETEGIRGFASPRSATSQPSTLRLQSLTIR